LYLKLRIAGSYLLRQGLFYPGLFFIGTGGPELLLRACRAFHELNKEAQILLSKTRESQSNKT
jgi:hypothetical protein